MTKENVLKIRKKLYDMTTIRVRASTIASQLKKGKITFDEAFDLTNKYVAITKMKKVDTGKYEFMMGGTPLGIIRAKSKRMALLISLKEYEKVLYDFEKKHGLI